METFRRARIVEPEQVILDHVKKSEPEASQVRIAVKASAICGSDMHIFSGRHPYVKLPTTIGHELSGVVEAVGSEVKKLKIGDRVCVEPLITCGTCYWCRHGRYDYCENLRLKYRSGFSAYADYYYADEQWCHVLPDNLSFEEGALMEPLACTVHAVMKANIQLCDSVAVMGDGPIALMIAQLARAAGATRIWVLGLLERNLELARQFGCIPLRSSEEAVEEIIRQTNGRGVDVAFEAVGAPVTYHQSIQVVRRGGKDIIFGIFEKDFSARETLDAMVREIEIIGTSSYCWDFQRGLELVSRGVIDVKCLISHTFPLADVQQAMTLKRNTQGLSLFQIR